jgi:hypothetical protein
MEIKAKSEMILRDYLLGNVTSQQQEEVELWLMSDPDAYDLLEAAEDDLVDDALAGRLTERNLSLFNSHFLAAPERHRKMQFGRSFKRAIDARQHAARAAHTVERGAPARVGWLDLLRQPAVAFASMGLIVLLLIGTGWSVYKVFQLQQQLGSTTQELASTARDRDDLKRRLDQSQTAAQSLQEQVRALEATKSSETPVLLAVNLMPGLTRSSSDISTVNVAAKTNVVRFSLTLLDDNFPTYRASLRNADDRELLSRDKLAATATRDGKAVVFTIPAETLSAGDYSFSLQGVPVSGTPENAARYSFRVSRQ